MDGWVGRASMCKEWSNESIVDRVSEDTPTGLPTTSLKLVAGSLQKSPLVSKKCISSKTKMTARKSCVTKTDLISSENSAVDVLGDVDESALILERVLNGKTTLKCHECDFVTHIRKIMTRHLLKHRLHCDLCPFSTFTKTQLIEHRELEHNISESAAADDGFIIIEQVDYDSDDNLDEAEEREVEPKCDEMLIGLENRTVQDEDIGVSDEVRDDIDNGVGDSMDRVVPVRGEDGLYHCSECLYSSSHEAAIRRHHAHHVVDGPVKCPHCTFRSSSHHRIRTHVSLDHFVSNRNVEAVDTVADVKSEPINNDYSTNSFQLSTQEKSQLIKVEAAHDGSVDSKLLLDINVESDNMPSILCPICRKHFKSRTVFKGHCRVIHSGVPVFLCPKCEVCYTTDVELLHHNELCHNIPEIRTGSSRIDLSIKNCHKMRMRCCFCHKWIKTRALVLQHFQSEHKNDTVFLCPNCNHCYKSSVNLLHHVSRTHGNKACDDIDIDSPDIRICSTRLGSDAADKATHQSQLTSIDRPVWLKSDNDECDELCTVVNVEEGTVTRIRNELQDNLSFGNIAETGVKVKKKEIKHDSNISPKRRKAESNNVLPSFDSSLNRDPAEHCDVNLPASVRKSAFRSTKKFVRNLSSATLQSNDLLQNIDKSLKPVSPRKRLRRNSAAVSSVNMADEESHDISSITSEKSSLNSSDHQHPTLLCPCCRYRTRCPIKFEKHKTRHNLLYSCSVCEFRHACHETAVRHISEHMSELNANLCESISPKGNKGLKRVHSNTSLQSGMEERVNDSDSSLLKARPRKRSKTANTKGNAKSKIKDKEAKQETIKSSPCKYQWVTSSPDLETNSVTKRRKVGNLTQFIRKKLPNGSHLYFCRGCSFSCSLASDAREHSGLCGVNKSETVFMCPHCPYFGKYYSKVYRHTKTNHKGIVSMITRKVVNLEDRSKQSAEEQVVEMAVQNVDESLSDNVKKVKLVACKKKNTSSLQYSLKQKLQISRVQKKFRLDMKNGYYKNLQCSVCGLRSDREYSLKTHIRTRHENVGMVTLIDNDEAKHTLVQYISSLDRMAMHIKSKAIQTKVNEACRLTKNNNKSNETAEDKSLESVVQVSKERGLRRLKCSECDARYEWYRSVKRHIASNHPNATVVTLSAEMAARPYQCEELPGMEYTEGQTDSVEQESQKYSCGICTFQSNTRGRIEEHQKFIHGITAGAESSSSGNIGSNSTKLIKFKEADLCNDNAVLAGSSPRKRIKKVVKQDKLNGRKVKKGKLAKIYRYKCDICPYITMNKKDLLCHKRLHKKQKGFDICCKFCPFYVKNQWHLNSHMLIHRRADNSCAQAASDSVFTTSVNVGLGAIALNNISADTPCAKQQLIAQKSIVRSTRDPDSTHKVCGQSVSSGVSASEADASPFKANSANLEAQNYTAQVNTTLDGAYKSNLAGQMPESRHYARKSGVSNQNKQRSRKSFSNYRSIGYAVRKTESCKEDTNQSDNAGRSLVCELCPYATSSISNYSAHNSLHGSKLRFECEYCSYSVTHFHELQAHRWSHLTPHPNLLYSQSIGNLQNLPQQEEIESLHTSTLSLHPSLKRPAELVLAEELPGFNIPLRLFRCDQCPFSSSRKGAFMKHYGYHTVRGAFSCPFCSFEAQAQQAVTDHVVLHFNLPGCELNALPDSECSDSYIKSVIHDIKSRCMKDAGSWYGSKYKKQAPSNEMCSLPEVADDSDERHISAASPTKLEDETPPTDSCSLIHNSDEFKSTDPEHINEIHAVDESTIDHFQSAPVVLPNTSCQKSDLKITDNGRIGDSQCCGSDSIAKVESRKSEISSDESTVDLLRNEPVALSSKVKISDSCQIEEALHSDIDSDIGKADSLVSEVTDDAVVDSENKIELNSTFENSSCEVSAVNDSREIGDLNGDFNPEFNNFNREINGVSDESDGDVVVAGDRKEPLKIDKSAYSPVSDTLENSAIVLASGNIDDSVSG